MTLNNPYVLSLWLTLLSISSSHAITLYSQSSGTWATFGGTTALFNDAANGSGTAYDGNTTAWQGATVDIVIQAGHTIDFRHGAFIIGSLTIELGAKLFANDNSAFFNYLLDIRGSTIHVDGKLGNGVPVDPNLADRIGLITAGGNMTGAGEITLRELQWDFLTAPLKVVTTLNMHMYYNGAWDTFYLYNSLGSGIAQTLTVGTGGHLNVYGNFAADFDLRFPNTGSSNASDFFGKLTIDGSMSIQEGNLLLKNDNSLGQNFTLAINTDGHLLVKKSILGNGGTGDPSPYPGDGIDLLDVTGTLESEALNPAQYTSTRAVINMNNAGSLMKLSGAANQLLDDDVLGGRYYNVEMAGTGPKMLEGTAAIDNSLNLNAGILELGNNDLTMTKVFASGETNNTFTNVGPTQFVETNGSGKLKAHMPAGGFLSPGYLTLPVGKTTYNPVTFQSYGFVGDFMSARVADQVLSDGTSGSPITSHSLNKTWFIEEDVTGGANLNLSLSWTIQDQSVDFNQLKTYISHYTNNAWDTDPQFAGGKQTAASGGVFTVTRNGANDFSPFTVFSLPSVPLPVEWISFEAKAIDQQVKLDWVTAWEEDNSHFVIEHSLDGKRFVPIGSVKSTGNNIQEEQYTFIHHQPSKGLNYYRLKQVDHSGEFEFSGIRSVQLSGIVQKNRLRCFPNPVQDQLTIEILSGEIPSAPIWIVNSFGQLVKKIPIRDLQQQVDISTLMPGTYQLILQNPNEIRHLNFVKK